ncbi:hypothetical protein [Paenibacillus xylanexedens]|uniref:hypothetical protein n=1 Tax=Paenibacillus xylanexedens TaxID=528191 RepID=UPI0011A016F0|nr:hypothetical protein [Paenibacillus xylanexedens]
MINEQYYEKLNQDAIDNYLFYKQEAEAKVHRREYITSKRYDIMPFWLEREGQIPGELSNEETDTYYEFDDQGRLLILACDDLIDGYTYVTYKDDLITTRTYVEGTLDGVKEYWLQGGHVYRSVEYLSRFNKINVEEYIYEGNLLVQVYQPQYENNKYYDHLVRTYFEYDEQGKLLRVLDGTQGVIYVRMADTEVQTLRETVKKELMLAVKQTIDKLCDSPSESSYCFLSIYLHDEVHAVYSPMFNPGWDEVREEQIEEKDEHDEYYHYRLWSSGEHPLNDQQELEDHDLIQRLRTLIIYWRSRGDWFEEGKRLWQEVAYELNVTTKWSEYSQLTDHFVVFVEWEAMDIMNGDLHASIPAGKLELLRLEDLAPNN